MKISLFVNAYDNEPKPWEGTWEQFAERLSEHKYTRTAKEDCPAFSPAVYPPGTTQRLDKLVTELSFFAIDVDNVDEEEALKLCSTIEELGVDARLYTTWRHAEASPLFKLRPVIRLSRPVSAASWEGFWVRANALFGGVCDEKCKNTSRIYFEPYAPPGTEDKNFCLKFEGEPLDVDLVMQVDPGYLVSPAVPEGTSTCSRDAFERYAKMLAGKRGNDRASEVGDILLKVVRGEVFASKGERDTVVYEKLSKPLAGRFIDCTPESIAEHFRPSLALMAKLVPGDAFTVEDVAYKIRRRQADIRAEQQQAEDHKRLRIREAFRNGRDTPYTVDEIKSFGPLIRKRWVIQRGRSFYFFCAGTYVGPYTTDDMHTSGERELAPASSAGVELWKLSKEGVLVPKNSQQIVSQYGTVAQQTMLDLTAQKSRYDEETRTIIEAPCPMRAITPKFHPAIDRWLQLMAGDKYEQLKTWLAAVTKLDAACVALFLTEWKGTGKSLLAHGVSRIWTIRGPTPLEDVFANFNEPLVHCPLCFADEQLPKDFRGHTKNADLRQHIQAKERQLRRKFHPNAVIKGATRTIIAANNENVLSTQEHLSSFDIDAIIDRYFHVPTQKVAAEYLSDTDTTGWVSEDKIAEHVLWLVENHVWTPKGRFLMSVEDQTLYRALNTRTGVRSAICQWLVSYLLNPKLFDTDARSKQFVRVKGKKLLVNVQGLIACWEHYVQNERCPPTGHLASDLAALCESECDSSKKDPRLRYINESGARVNYRVFNVENLIAWAEKSGFADREQIEKALSVDTQVLRLKGTEATN